MKRLTLSLLLLSYGATAQDAPASSASKPAVTYKKNTTLDFEGRSVDGDVMNPDSADVEGEKNIRFDPLLDGRKDFKREFKRSSGVSK